MISGLNQEVNVLGKTFHFQTELTHNVDLFIRTEVFVGGKVVATRERRLERAERGKLDEEGIRALMKEQHNRVIGRTRERVKAYHEKKGQMPSGPAASLPVFDGQQADNYVLPSEEIREAASSAVRIRRIFGRFRLRLGLGSSVTPDEFAGRLETAARGFSWILTSPTFQEIRLDEQMRCHLVSDQVNAWLAGGRDDLARAEEIWSEVVTFNDYVISINNRSELIAFDRQLLTWAAFRVQKQGISTEVLDWLQWLAGRDLELDGLLDKPGDVADQTWFAVLCHVLAQIPRLKP